MKHILLLTTLLTISLTSIAQDPTSDRTARHVKPTSGLAPVEELMRQTEAARPMATVRRAGQISSYSWNRSSSRWGEGTINTYLYDNQGRTSGYTGVDSISQTPLYRHSFAYYNLTTNQTQSLREIWQGGNWQNSYRFLSLFDAQGNETEFLKQVWNNGVWENDYQYLLTYNLRGALIKELYREWDNNTWTAENGYELISSYDTSGRLVEEQMTEWIPALNAQVLTYRFLYAYQGSNTRYDSYDYQLWTNGAWLNYKRYTGFTYSAQGRPTYHQTQTWDGTTWQLSGRTTYAYAASNPGYSYLEEILNGGNWINESRFNSSYDSKGTPLGGTFERWRNNSWVFSSGNRYTVGYNADNDLSRRLIEFTFNPVVNHIKSFYTNYQTIVLGTKTRAAGPQVQLYPNPTAGTATLELAATTGDVYITVLNALGQAVQQLMARAQAGTLRQPLNVAALPAGVYSVRVSTAAGTTVRQLVRH